MRKNISLLVLLILSLTACSDKGQYFEESGSVFADYIKQGQAKPNRIDRQRVQHFNLSLKSFQPQLHDR